MAGGRTPARGRYLVMAEAGNGPEGWNLKDALFELGESHAEGGRRFLDDPRVILVLRIVLAAVFIYAALQKTGKPLLFADKIKMYDVIGTGPLLYIMAISLPWIELVCGLSLLTGIFMRGSALILAVFNVVFIAVISYRTYGIMGREGTPFMEVYFDCGCGFGATYAWKKLIEDIVLFFCAGAVVLTRSQRFRIPVFRRPVK